MCMWLSSELLFSWQVHAHTKAAGCVWARRPLLWSVHQHQLHPGFVRTGWVWVNLQARTEEESPKIKIFVVTVLVFQVSMWPWPLIAGGVSTPASRCLITWWWWCQGTSTARTRGVVCCDGLSWDTPTYPQSSFSVLSAQGFTSVSQLWIT